MGVLCTVKTKACVFWRNRVINFDWLDLKYSQWSILCLELRTLPTFRGRGGELASFKADTKGGIVLPLTAEPSLKEETSPFETSAFFTSWGDAVSKRVR